MASCATPFGKSRGSITQPPDSLSPYPPPSNPTTSYQEKVPKLSRAYYFGHDPETDQYKVVCTTGVYVKHLRQIKSEHRVFVLKAGGGGFWRKAHPTTPADFLPHIPAKGGVCIDGVIYYLGWTGGYKTALVSFRISSREFKMIQVPRRDGDKLPRRVRNLSLIEYNGKVTIIDQTNLFEKGMLDLWDVDKHMDKWRRKSVVLQPCQLQLVNKNIVFNVRGTTQNGKVFLIPEDLFSPFHILSYDLGSNGMRKMEIKGVPDQWFSKDKSAVYVMLLDQSESLMYLEA